MRLAGLAIAAALTCFATGARASEAEAGYISSILSFGDGGVVFFNHSGTRSTLPTCNGVPALQTRWAINTSTAAGQARLAVLLSAYGLNKRIEIVGLGNCSLWGDTETVNYFVIKD
jgi:hypothetical protein